MDEIEKIESNWNTTFVEKGDELYELGKTAECKSQKQKERFIII